MSVVPLTGPCTPLLPVIISTCVLVSKVSKLKRDSSTGTYNFCFRSLYSCIVTAYSVYTHLCFLFYTPLFTPAAGYPFFAPKSSPLSSRHPFHHPVHPPSPWLPAAVHLVQIPTSFSFAVGIRTACAPLQHRHRTCSSPAPSYPPQPPPSQPSPSWPSPFPS